MSVLAHRREIGRPCQLWVQQPPRRSQAGAAAMPSITTKPVRKLSAVPGQQETFNIRARNLAIVNRSALKPVEGRTYSLDKFARRHGTKMHLLNTWIAPAKPRGIVDHTMMSAVKKLI